MGEKKLDRLPSFGDQQVDFQTLEIPFLARKIATKTLLRVELGSGNPNITDFSVVLFRPHFMPTSEEHLMKMHKSQ